MRIKLPIHLEVGKFQYCNSLTTNTLIFINNVRQTPGNQPMYMAAGTAYVYMTYGMYFCFNISSIEPGAAVLLRALEPIQGLEVMHGFRTGSCSLNSGTLI